MRDFDLKKPLKPGTTLIAIHQDDDVRAPRGVKIVSYDDFSETYEAVRLYGRDKEKVTVGKNWFHSYHLRVNRSGGLLI